MPRRRASRPARRDRGARSACPAPLPYFELSNWWRQPSTRAHPVDQALEHVGRQCAGAVGQARGRDTSTAVPLGPGRSTRSSVSRIHRSLTLRAQHVVERTLHPILWNDRAKVAQRPRDVRAQDAVDLRVVARVPHPVSVHHDAGQLGMTTHFDSDLDDPLGEAVKPMRARPRHGATPRRRQA